VLGRSTRSLDRTDKVTKISSKWTMFHKWIFPAMWFGGLIYFVVSSWAMNEQTTDPMIFVVPVIMAIFGVVLMKKLIWDLADAVYDCGDSLLVRKRGMEERIHLSNIINVSVSTMSNPPRITLRLDKPGRLGNEIAFSPVFPAISFNPFPKSKVGDDLIVRVDRARVKRAV
jgi:hypothetical protein